MPSIAKDAVTHGHICLVQSLAVALAARVGIQDEQEVRAIEAAALLHDIGKLAVPEHILNKPSKLTPAEFERMKSHARVGAEISPKWTSHIASCRLSATITKTGMGLDTLTA